MVIFDGISRADHSCPFQPGNTGHHCSLDVFRKRGGNSVRIDRSVVEAFGLKEDLVAVPLAEADNLVLDRGAITRPAALDLPGIHWRPVNICSHNLVRRLDRTRDRAVNLRIRDPLGQRREWLRRFIARLRFQAHPVDSLAVEPGRRPGLQPPERKTQSFEGHRQPKRRCLPNPARRRLYVADMDEPTQKSAGRQHNGACGQAPSIRERHAGHPPVVLQYDIVRFAFENREALDFADCSLHRRRIQFAIGLGTWSADRGTLSTIENAKLDAAKVGHSAHQAVESVNLAHEVALTQTSDGRIARHRTDRVEAMRHQCYLRAHTRSRGCSLAAGMASADHDHVVAGVHRQKPKIKFLGTRPFYRSQTSRSKLR